MRISLILLVAVAALLAGVMARSRHTPVPPAAAVDLASVSFPDLDGRQHTLDEWKGKVLVVNFWATWCPPCLKEMPAFVKLQEEFADEGLQFAGIAIDDADSVRAFLATTPINYPILIGEQGGEEWAATLGNHARVLPFSAVFNRDGQLLHVEAGPFEREALLEKVGPALGIAIP